MDFEPYFKVDNLVSIHLKSIILGEMTNGFGGCCGAVSFSIG